MPDAARRLPHPKALLRLAACPHAARLDAVDPAFDAIPQTSDLPELGLSAPPQSADMLALLQQAEDWEKLHGRAALNGRFLLPDGQSLTLRLADYRAYGHELTRYWQAFQSQATATTPQPCAACPSCPHLAQCQSQWQQSDSLHSVAGLDKRAAKQLQAAGITTAKALTALDHPVAGLPQPSQERLIAQARLQAGEASYLLRPLQAGKGLSLMPRPDMGDSFYLCRDPDHHLLGAAGSLSNSDAAVIFAQLRAGIDTAPHAHIYHFGTQALQALRQTASRLGIAEAWLDRMLREGRFIDLQAVLKAAVLWAARDYSLAAFAAVQAIDPLETPALLQELRAWLLSLRPDTLDWPALPATADLEATALQEAAADQELDALRAQIAASNLPQDRQYLLLALALFHDREAKPAKWAVFDSVTKDPEALLTDTDALGGLQALGPVAPIKRSAQRAYRFAPQDTKLRAGKSATVASENGPPVGVQIAGLDRRACEVVVKVGMGKSHLLRDHLDLHPDWPLRTDGLADALRDVIDDHCGAQDYTAVAALLAREAPRLRGRAAGNDILQGLDPVEGVTQAVLAMDHTVLPIQGPPGTGKTYVTARAIRALLAQGHRVGVASNSHEAVRNLLLGCEAALIEAPLPRLPDMVHKIGSGEDHYPLASRIRRTTDNAIAAAGGDLVGGTAFFFTRPENIQAFDWLVVDEAGQVGLANMAAMGRAARNLVLVGDPCQLPQVVQGAHPAPADLSCLEWLLGDQPTLPADRGIFLPVSRRMHPDICAYISGQIYEDRLQSHADTGLQAVEDTPLPQAGAYWVATPHDDNIQTCDEEADAIHASIAQLLQGRWRDKTGQSRAMRPQDIIVVAPFNAQVNLLQDRLPQGIRIGTVDKFQGQEAPVCLVSMTASSAQDAARGLDFLMSRNRLNVAVSRAKALALVFGAPALRRPACADLDEMRLVNTLCALPSLPAG